MCPTQTKEGEVLTAGGVRGIGCPAGCTGEACRLPLVRLVALA